MGLNAEITGNLQDVNQMHPTLSFWKPGYGTTHARSLIGGIKWAQDLIDLILPKSHCMSCHKLEVNSEVIQFIVSPWLRNSYTIFSDHYKTVRNSTFNLRETDRWREARRLRVNHTTTIRKPHSHDYLYKHYSSEPIKIQGPLLD